MAALELALPAIAAPGVVAAELLLLVLAVGLELELGKVRIARASKVNTTAVAIAATRQNRFKKSMSSLSSVLCRLNQIKQTKHNY
jgi:hypothetical protein